jgi:signal transduction histidine kinase
MGVVTVLWSLGAAVAMVMAAICALAWISKQRDIASLILCALGIATAVSAYLEFGMLHSATATEFGEWQRWYYLSSALALISMVLFVHYYLETSTLWLMGAAIFARLIVIVVNFSVHPNFGFSEIISLRSVFLFGEQVSIIGVAIPSGRDWFAIANLLLFIAFLTDAVIRAWLHGGIETRRKAWAVVLGILAPLLCTAVYVQLLVFGVLHGILSTLPWFLGTLMTMAYELGHDVITSRRVRLELAEARAELAQIERVSALGQLASTLAHELGQPLTAISANVDAAVIQLRRGNAGLEELGSILSDIGSDNHRASQIIGQMRQLFRRQSIEMYPLRVEDVVHGVISLVRPEATSKHVVLCLLIQPGLPLVWGDRVHLSQVLLNLVMNGIDAVQCRPLDARRITVQAQFDAVNDEVEVTVQDSGPGISVRLVDQVFKPFFTTKSHGMGVGLSLSRSIIEAHGGRMWTERADEQTGAIFRFTLRRAAKPFVGAETNTATKMIVGKPDESPGWIS